MHHNDVLHEEWHLWCNQWLEEHRWNVWCSMRSSHQRLWSEVHRQLFRSIHSQKRTKDQKNERARSIRQRGSGCICTEFSNFRSCLQEHPWRKLRMALLLLGMKTRWRTMYIVVARVRVTYFFVTEKNKFLRYFMMFRKNDWVSRHVVKIWIT